MRRALPAAVLLAAGLLTAACSPGSAGSGADPGSAASDASAALSEATDVGWSPCEQTGTTDQPRCAFTPVAEGGPAFDVNYLFFDGGLDEAWRTMGPIRGRVSRIAVPGADAARLVVHARRPAVLVTGFVQSGGLVQSVNAV
ncbi:MAG: hypothetical protein HYU55_09955, partial [Nocardioides sp.]|nr:hypothetical protein [Nocardioides sp.]